MAWGQVAQHRKHSQKGGRKVGRHKHLWSYVIRYDPEYFGRKGFIPRSNRLGEKINVINVGELDELVGKLAADKKLENREGKAFLDLDALGYQKLLASGKIVKPVLVKVEMHSEKAAQKIEQAGGQIIADEGETKEDSEEFEAGETPDKG